MKKCTGSSAIDSWDQVMHRLFSPYVKLYVGMSFISTYLIVAHRNLISLYDMAETKRQGWVDTIKVAKDHVRSLNIKKRPKN